MQWTGLLTRVVFLKMVNLRLLFFFLFFKVTENVVKAMYWGFKMMDCVDALEKFSYLKQSFRCS